VPLRTSFHVVDRLRRRNLHRGKAYHYLHTQVAQEPAHTLLVDSGVVAASTVQSKEAEFGPSAVIGIGFGF